MTGEPSLVKRPSITPTLDTAAPDGVGRPSGARITADAPVGTGPRLVSDSSAEPASVVDAAKTAAALSTPGAEATSKGAAESVATPTGYALKELSSERGTGGSSSVVKQSKAGGTTSASATKSKRRKDGRRGSEGGGGSRSSSRRASLQRSQASSLGKAGKSSSSSERQAVAALLIRRPSTDSKSSQRSNRSTRYVGDKPKVPPPLDIFSREHSSMAESPPAVTMPGLTPSASDAASKPAQGLNEVPSEAADKPAAAP